MKRSLVCCLLLVTACAAGAGGAAAALVPPPGYAAPVGDGDGKIHDCPRNATPYVKALNFPSKYAGSDEARDDLNARSEREYVRRTAPITALEKGVARQVDDYIDTGRREALECALRLLADWSAARGLEGPATTHSGKSMRKWALGSVASAYLRLKFSASRPLREVDAGSVRQIEQWMARLAERVVDEWSDQPPKKVNNHEYWAAWAVTAAAVALDRRDLFDWGMQQYRYAARQIDDEGYLPNELKRDTRALFYHNYALAPLAMIAAFGKANGIDLASENDRALERLARRVIEGVDDPDDFEDKTGEEQVVPDPDERSKFAWLEPYCWTFTCDPEMQEKLEELRPLSSTRLGGKVSDLFSG